MILATYAPCKYFLIDETEIIAEVTSAMLGDERKLKMTWCQSQVDEYFKDIAEIHEIYGLENWPFEV